MNDVEIETIVKGRHQVTHTPNAECLGDGVYADIAEGRGLVLTAENGLHATDVIVLDPPTFYAMMQYVTRKPAR